MPELPEIETIARAIRTRVTGARITKVRTVDHPHWIDARAAKGATIIGVRRLGKHLLLDLDDAWTLDVHLGMTGNLRLGSAWTRKPEAHERARLGLQQGAHEQSLQLVDPRGFGHMQLGERTHAQDVALPALQKLGPDAWTAWSSADLRAVARRRSTAIKAVLLDQQSVAGIGNYIADEALFRAGVHPGAPANTLSSSALERLHAAVLDVIAASINAQGATLRDYRGADGERGGMQHLLLAYGRAGEPCTKCGRALLKSRVAGRGTTHCPQCQRLRRSRRS